MKTNVAVIGAGRIGRIHARNAANHPELNLAAIVDPNEAAAAEIASQTGCKVASLDEVLGDQKISGVVIASSTDTHLDYILRAADADKVIFCEKPVDMDLERAKSALARLQSQPVLIGFNRRFDPNFRALREKLGEQVGALETLQITSNDPGAPPIDYIKVSGGMFKDMSIHDFDMARWLLGEAVVEVFAWGACLVDPAIGEAGDIDTARIMLRTATGKICVISNSRRSGFGYDQRVEAFCSGGLVAAGNETESTVQVWGPNGSANDSFRNFFLDRYAAAYAVEMNHFADILAGRCEPSVTYADGVAALELAEAAQQSMKSGLPVKLGN